MSNTILAKSAKPFFWLGSGLILLGALSIYAPQMSGMTVSVLVGTFLVLAGVIRAMLFWIASSWGSALFRLAFGILAIVAGGTMIVNPSIGLQVITIVAIVYLVVDGLTALAFGLVLPRHAGGAWIIISGVLSIALGVMIWREWPLRGDQAVGVLIGIKLIVDGVVLIALASVIRALDAALFGTPDATPAPSTTAQN